MIKVCPICGKEFEISTNRKKCCSPRCYKKYEKEQHKRWYEKNKDDYNKRRRFGEHCEYKRTCPICGKRLISSQPNAIFCSVECRIKKVDIPGRTCLGTIK